MNLLVLIVAPSLLLAQRGKGELEYAKRVKVGRENWTKELTRKNLNRMGRYWSKRKRPTRKRKVMEMLTRNCRSFKRRRRARVYQNLFDEIFSLERELEKSKRELVRKEEQIKMMKRREVKLTAEIIKAKAHKSLEGLRNSTTEIKSNFVDKVHVFFLPIRYYNMKRSFFCTRFIPSSEKEKEAYVVGGGLEESSAGWE